MHKKEIQQIYDIRLSLINQLAMAVAASQSIQTAHKPHVENDTVSRIIITYKKIKNLYYRVTYLSSAANIFPHLCSQDSHTRHCS